jgi:Ca2+-binding EF-hand superfamily protein
VFDRLGEGTINADMFKHVMLTLGEPLTEEDVDEIINDADTLRDGNIDMENFIRYGR